MAQNEDETIDDKLRSILTVMCQSEIVNIDKTITDIKMLFDDERLEGIEQMMESRRKEKVETSEQLTLGELIEQLEKVPNKDLPVILDGCYYPSGLSSWRGDYAELAIEYDGDVRMFLSKFLEMLKGAVGKTYDGYKGGLYKMRSDTPLWVANYGTTQGFKNGGDHYQAVSDVLWSDRGIFILTDCLEY